MAAVLTGAMTVAGLVWLGWITLARTPAARPALRRLYPTGVGILPRSASRVGRARGWAGRLWRPPMRELTLLGRTPAQYATTLAACAGTALLVVVTVAVLAGVAGFAPPVAVPAVVGLAVAGTAAWIAHRDLLARAKRARYEFRQAICSYLDLVSLEMAAGHGPVAALELAATNSHGPVFTRLRHTLLQSQLQLQQPWDTLRELAERIDVPELGDVGDIVHAAGADGATVTQTLLDRAGSLRDQIRVEALARAKATTSQLDIPAAVLLLLLAAFVLYPLLIRFVP